MTRRDILLVFMGLVAGLTIGARIATAAPRSPVDALPGVRQPATPASAFASAARLRV